MHEHENDDKEPVVFFLVLIWSFRQLQTNIFKLFS